jgi:hypothetical protein
MPKDMPLLVVRRSAQVQRCSYVITGLRTNTLSDANVLHLLCTALIREEGMNP